MACNCIYCRVSRLAGVWYLCFLNVFCHSSPTTSFILDLANDTNAAEWQNASHLLDQLLDRYDRKLRPDFGVSPTLIDVNLNVRSMGPVSELNMAYQMDCYFRQSWVDPRLRFTEQDSHLQTLPVSVNILERIWKPDTHFFNGRQSYLHTVTTPNKLLRINRDGRILYSMRITIKASCPMHLEKFPMDTQACPLKFGSHGYTEDDVLYHWTYGNDKSIKMASDMTLSQFDLIGCPAGNESAAKAGSIQGQSYSILFASFILKRHMGYFLINVYVPSGMLVVISWVSFWINREATADRIALGITTVLTMAFLGIENRHDLPRVPYSTALDVYVGVCFAFILASILQFSGVHFFTKHGSGEVFLIPESSSSGSSSSEEEDDLHSPERHKEDGFAKDRRSSERRFCSIRRVSIRSYALQRRHSHSHGINGSHSSFRQPSVDSQHGSPTHRQEHEQWRRRCSAPKETVLSMFWNCLKGSVEYRELKMKSSTFGINSVSQIDSISRIVFPVTFTIFNVVYWIWYLYASEDYTLRIQRASPQNC